MATLYRKYRPQIFDEVVGQENIIMTLRRALKLGRVAHAYLFCGARGVGKTTVARILAKAVNCLDDSLSGERPCGKCRNCLDIAKGRFIDLIEIDAASNRGIDEMRDLRDKIKFAPTTGKKKVYIIDEVHMLTREAFNALLKTLEEPPEHSIFIFATTEVHKVPQTIISRCQRFDFRLGDSGLVEESIKKIAKSEKLKLSDDVTKLIAKISGGSYRDAQTLLGQLAPSMVEEEIPLEMALELLHLSGEAQVLEFLSDIKSSQVAQAINLLDSLAQRGVNYEEFLSQLIAKVRSGLIEKVKSAENGDWERHALEILMKAVLQIKISPVEVLPLELAAIDICDQPKAESQISRIKNKELRIKNREADEKPNVDNKTLNSKFLTLNSKSPENNKMMEPTEKAQVVRKDATDSPNFSSEQKLAIVEAVSSKNKPLGALISGCEWKIDGERLILLVEYPLYKDKIMGKNSVAMIEREIEDIVNVRLKIECIVNKKKEVDEEIGEVFDIE